MTEGKRPLRMHGRDQRIWDMLRAAGIVREGDYVRRVIIDINVTDAVVVHIERYGDERLLELFRGLGGAEIRTLPRPEGGQADPGTATVTLTSEEVLLLRQRLAFDGPGTPAVNSPLDAKLYRTQLDLRGRSERA